GNENAGVVGVHTGDGAEAGGLASQAGAERRCHSRANSVNTVVRGQWLHDAVDAVAVGVESIVAEFERHIKIDHQAGEDSEGETENIDAGGELMAAETAQREKQ